MRRLPRTFLLCAVLLALSAWIAPLRAAAPPETVYTLRAKGNVGVYRVEMDTGLQLMAVNRGTLDGNNRGKLYDKAPGGLPTTLWNAKRRKDCYERSIRIMAQMPLATESLGGIEHARQAGALIFDKSPSALAQFTTVLNLVYTNYSPGLSTSAELFNKAKTVLRAINPKSAGGQYLFPHARNLGRLSGALEIMSIGAGALDFAVGAAIQEALAGDLALMRLDVIEQAMLRRRAVNEPMDPIIFDAIAEARESLLRSEDYWGALMQELSDRKSDVAALGVRTVMLEINKHLPAILLKHVSGLTAAKASVLGGAWGISLTSTYLTIDAILDHHKKVQCASTASTMAYLLNEEITAGRTEGSAMTKSLVEQAEYEYYDHLVQATSGLLGSFHDVMSPGHDYKDAREYFSKQRDLVRGNLERHAAQVLGEAGNALSAASDLALGIIIDSSGSMSRNDPKKIRCTAAEMILDRLSGAEDVFIVDFDSRAVWLNPDNWHGWDMEKLRRQVNRIDASGTTDIGVALDTMAKIMQDRLAANSQAGVVLLTDGKGRYNNEVNWFVSKGIPVFTVSLAGNENSALLTRLARQSGGEYIKANTSMDIVDAFNRFFSFMGKGAILAAEEGRITQGETRASSFYVDSGSQDLFLTCLWQGSTVGVRLRSPGGTLFDSIADREHFRIGPNYLNLKIPRPEAGKWLMELIGVDIPQGGEEYRLEVNAGKTFRTDLACAAKDLSTYDGGALRFNVTFPDMTEPPRDMQARVFLTGPNNKIRDISPSFSGGGFSFFPGQGKGNYQLHAVIRGTAPDGIPFQRHLKRSLYLEKVRDSRLGRVLNLDEGYLDTDIGIEVGNQVGVACYVVREENGLRRRIAKGYVTNVRPGAATVEVQEYLTPAAIVPTDQVELDLNSWMQD